MVRPLSGGEIRLVKPGELRRSLSENLAADWTRHRAPAPYWRRGHRPKRVAHSGVRDYL